MMMRFPIARHAAWIFFLLTALFYCRGIFEGKILIATNSDEIKNYICSMAYVHQWSPSVFPLWNTLNMCGHPFGVAALASYNMFNLAAFFIEPGLAYSLIKLVGIFLNGLFFYIFLRRTCGVWAALVPAWIWMVARIELDAGFFLLPLLLLLGDLYLERPGRGRFAALTAALAFYNLNSNPQYVIYTYLFLGVYLIWMGRDRSIFRKIFTALLPLVLAAGLTAFFWCRAIELLALSNRSMRSEVAVFFPTHFLLWFFPNLFNIQDRPDLGFVVPRIFQTLFSWSSVTRRIEVFLPPPYLGIGAFTAFLFYLMNRGGRALAERGMRFFFWVALAVVGYLTFHPILYLLIVRHLPVFQGMTGVERLFLYVDLCMLIIMSRVLQEWTVPAGGLDKKIRGLAKFFAFLSGGLIAVLLTVRAAVHLLREPLSHLIVSNLKAKDNPTIFVGNFDAFSHRRVEEFFEFFNLWTSPLNPHVLLPLTAAAVFFLLLHLHASGRIGTRVFRTIFLMLVIADVGMVRGFARDATPPEQVFKDQDAAAFFRKDPELFRVLMVEDSHTSYHQMFLVPEMNMSYSVATPDGYEYFAYLPYLRFYEWLTQRPEGAIGGYAHPLHHFDEELADFLNCKYLLTSVFNESFEAEAGYRKVWQNEKYRVYENLDVLPRVFTVRRSVTLSTYKAAGEYIQAHPERLREEVVLVGDVEGVAENPFVPGSDEIRVTRYTPHEVLLEARMKSDGFLVMTDNEYPGWKAEADGKPLPLLRADYAFRALRLSEGTHKIRLRYDPASMKLGWAIAFGALLVTAGLWWRKGK